ncbi:MAG: excinuclease ABC subunit UvrC [Clostridia bacterium]|nr:excinuclease ABC subunit UvrC [Clostridia bacterium]
MNIKEALKNLPDCPGVYLHKDRLGHVIYVGKAISLKKRVRQYFSTYGKSTAKLRALVSQIAEFEYITCSSEMEALALECNLIKRYMPKYNVLLRDDKTYPYIKVTTSEDFPRVLKTRILKKDQDRYFGPYTDASAVGEIINLLNDIYCIKRCSAKSFPAGFTPCLNYHIKECEGICAGKISREEYMEKVDQVLSFLGGNFKPVLKDLQQKMEEASKKLEFEKAAKLRNQIMAINSIAEKQRVSMTRDEDLDILVPVFTEENSSIALFPVRNGKMLGRELFPMEADLEDKDQLISEFIKQYYLAFANVPPEILVLKEPLQKELLEEFLSKDGRKVKIYTPMRGAKKALLDLAIKDSAELAKTLDDKIAMKKEKQEAVKEAFDKIRSALGYDVLSGEYRVESYDISNTNGVDSVGAMVVFSGLKPVKKAYRRFKIKTITGPDDYGSLREMLSRRFKRALEGDEGFKTLPDMILMDGGLGQVTSAEKVLKDLGIDILVLGMAKDDSHRTRALVSSSGMEIPLKDYPYIFSYLGTVQEEVHRFAISYHHNLHKKNTINSVLDDIPGIGPKKRNALLAHFKSVEAIKAASLEELMEAEGITQKNAEAIKNFFS